MNGSRVALPADVEPPFEVFVNGVRQTAGRDYAVDGGMLVFAERLTPPKAETARTLMRGFFFGRYTPEHVVDVAYQVAGRPQVASGLEILPPI